MKSVEVPPVPGYELQTLSASSDGALREGIFAVRMIVFVEEQAVPPEEELDAYDLTATHFCATCSTSEEMETCQVVATARLIDKGNKHAKIGRVAVLKHHRGVGLGFALMRHVERFAAETGFREIALEAQCHAIPFYEKLGYIAEGDIFLDAGIEHRLMRREL